MVFAPIINRPPSLIIYVPGDHVRVFHRVAEADRKPRIVGNNGPEDQIVSCLIIAHDELKTFPGLREAVILRIWQVTKT